MVSEEVKGMFPHELVRHGQEGLIVDMEKSFSENKILLAHAPTGLGKTASALAVALQQAVEKNKMVFFLTNRHTQHKIAVDTVKLINSKNGLNISVVDLIGKRWMCSQEIANLFGSDFNEFCRSVVEKGECDFYNNLRTKSGLTVEGKAKVGELRRLGPLNSEDITSFGKANSMCGYELAIAMAKKAKVIIGDYYYLFNPFVQTTLFNKLDISLEDVIVVVDEGHNLPTRMMDMMSNSLSSFMIKSAVMEARKFGYKGLLFWLQELNRVLNEMAKFSKGENELLVGKFQFMMAVGKFVDYDELINQIELAADEVRKKQRKSFLGGIGSFLEAWQGGDEGFARIISEQNGKFGPQLSLHYSCLDPSLVTRDIFSKVDAGVIMSGTLKPVFMYKELLGIGSGMGKEYPSPFPPENRLSLVIPETTTKFTMRSDAMYQKMANICSDICKYVPGNVALFFPSYYLRDQVGEFFKSDKKLFWEKKNLGKEEKEEFLSKFKEASQCGGVLLGVTGANFAEGVDLPGDLLKAVVVIGLPLAKPDLKTKEVIKYYDTKFGKGWDYGYTFPAVAKCIQSAGRCIRSETDRGVVIYLDERFAWQRYFDCLPKEGLIVTKDYGKYLKDFFK
jgi:DNA excision repair protein ERCC-2